jgi:hypothetical protein
MGHRDSGELPHAQHVTGAGPRPAPPAHPAALLDRRGFLRTTAGGTAALALASALPAGCTRMYPQAAMDGVELQALTAKEYAVARAAAEALLDGSVPVDPAAVARGIDAELAVAGDPMLSDMKTVLGLVEHLPFLSGRFRRFTALPPAQRRADLDGWKTSRFNLRRGAYQALRGFIVYFAYIQDETRTITQFRGPWREHIELPVYPVDFGEIA